LAHSSVKEDHRLGQKDANSIVLQTAKLTVEVKLKRFWEGEMRKAKQISTKHKHVSVLQTAKETKKCDLCGKSCLVNHPLAKIALSRSNDFVSLLRAGVVRSSPHLQI
jgi:uncharacterized Fe-S radical SAM superfamily protein PflX